MINSWHEFVLNPMCILKCVCGVNSILQDDLCWYRFCYVLGRSMDSAELLPFSLPFLSCSQVVFYS